MITPVNFAQFTVELKFRPELEKFIGSAGRFNNPDSNWGFVIDKVGTPTWEYLPYQTPMLATASARDFKEYFENVAAYMGNYVQNEAWGKSSLIVNREQNLLQFYLDSDYFKNALGVDIVNDKLFANIWTNSNDQSLSAIVSNPTETRVCNAEYGKAS